VIGGDTIPIKLLTDIVNSGQPLPPLLQQKHEVFKVETTGYRPVASNPHDFEQIKDERFFTTMKNAVQHIEKTQLKEFQPMFMVRGMMDHTFKYMGVIDETNGAWLAAKVGVWHPLFLIDIKSNVVRWHLNDKHISLAEFEEKSGLKISHLKPAGADTHSYQLYPPLEHKQEHKKTTKKSSNKKPGKGNTM
jgi:hypothetical protein